MVINLLLCELSARVTVVINIIVLKFSTKSFNRGTVFQVGW